MEFIVAGYEIIEQEPGIEGVTYYPTTRTFLLGVNLAF